MFALSPTFWGVIALLVALAAAAGFVKGMEWEQGKNARVVVETLVRVVKDIKTVIRADNATVNSLEADKIALKGELHEVRQEYAKIRDELNKRECRLPDSTVQLLNRARGASGSPPDPGKPHATVRALTPPAGWAAGGSGKPNDR